MLVVPCARPSVKSALVLFCRIWRILEADIACYLAVARSNAFWRHACRLPTPVQAEAVPLILGGGDVMAAAETGSGKTGAFALPILQIVHETVTTPPAQSSQNQQARY